VSPTPPVFRSVSTWRQPPAPEPSPARSAVLAAVTARVLAGGTGRLRVAVDGRTAAGKTTFADELAERLAAAGRPVLRACLDDFKRPWSERHLYDRQSGEGYYRNAFDLEAVQRLLLEPCAPDGTGWAALCSIDPLTQVDHSDVTVEVPSDAVLVLDGVFALRPELAGAWDLTVWLDVDGATALARGVARDQGRDSDAEDVHRDRYGGAEAVYLAEVDPVPKADVVVDTGDHAAPRLLRG
jgi:uridine kinase